ncbi:MAG: hypothetical protein ACRDRY_09670 [Pseudonocardiaceae bacterium]
MAPRAGLPDPPDEVVLPVHPEDASRYGWRIRPVVLLTRAASDGSSRPWVPPEGVAASGIEHVEDKSEVAGRDLGAVRPVQAPGARGEPQ